MEGFLHVLHDVWFVATTFFLFKLFSQHFLATLFFKWSPCTGWLYHIFFWCPIWGSSANKKKMSWKNEKYNLFDWKAQVQCIFSWWQNSRDFAYFILRLVGHWCGYKKGRRIKKRWKKSWDEKGSKKI